MSRAWKLWVAGSRDFPRPTLVGPALDWAVVLLRPEDAEVVILHGGARGVDRQADACAVQAGWRAKAVPADWNRYGRSAGMIRNEKLAEEADALLALWDGASPGTRHAIDLARQRGIPLLLVEVPR